MITLEMKLQAKRVAKQIQDLADEYADLMANDEIYESVLANLGQLPTGNELRALADSLMAIQNEQRCGVCGKLLKGKGRGSVQVFCSAVCRVKAHKQAKESARLQAEALAEADRLAALMLADNGGAEGDLSEVAKPQNAKKEKRSKAESDFAMTEQRAPFVPTCPKCNGNATKLKIYDGVLRCTDCGQIPMRDSFVAILKDLAVTHADCPNCHNHVYTLRGYDKLIFFCLTCDKRLEKIQADNGAADTASQESMPNSTEQADNGGAIRACDFCHKEIEVTSRNPNKRFCSANCRAKASKAARAVLEQK